MAQTMSTAAVKLQQLPHVDISIQHCPDLDITFGVSRAFIGIYQQVERCPSNR